MNRNVWSWMVVAGTVVIVSGLVGLARQVPSSPEARLGAAMHLEQVAGDLEGAIAAYADLASDASVSGDLAARALLHLARCYERLGRPEARATYQRILDEHPDSGDIADRARAKVAATAAQSGQPFEVQDLDAVFEGAELVTASADGRFVAYTRVAQGRTVQRFGLAQPVAVLYVRQLPDGRERVLFDPGPSDELVRGPLDWSPDGRYVAYIADLGETRERRLVEIATGAARTLVQGRFEFRRAIWSPDSQRLAFEIPESFAPGTMISADVLVSDARSGAPRSLGSTIRGTGVVWSPDSRRIAFVSADAMVANTVVATVDVATGAQSKVTVPAPPDGGRLVVTTWLPGDLIALRQPVPQVSNHRFVVPASGGPMEQICDGRGSTGGDGCGQITADGRFQILRKPSSDGGRMLLREIATKTDRPITMDSVFENVSVMPSRGGQLLAFRSDRDGRAGVYVVPTDRVPVERPVWLADLDSHEDRVAGFWTPDGLVLQTTMRQTNIYRLDMDRSTGRPVGFLRRLTQDAPQNRQAAPSPDGTRIAYIARNGPTVGVALMDANGANERLIFRSAPDLLPIGKTLAWRSNDELVLFNIGGAQSPPFALLDVGTGRLVSSQQPRLAGQGKQYSPASDELVYWDADVAFLRERSDSDVDVLGARNLRTGVERRWELPSTSRYFTLSHDGTQVVYSTSEVSDDEHAVVAGDIRIRALDGGDERVLVSFADSKGGYEHFPHSVSPNGRFLLYQDPDQVKLILDLTTSESWPLIDSPEDIDFSWSEASWAPDGSYIVIEGRQERTKWQLFRGVTHDAIVRLVEGGGR